MKITNLTIENFLAIEKASLKLADRGLVLVEGRNEKDSAADSNGSGKSSIADALCWALYGTTARGVSGDEVVNILAGKGTIVKIDIEDGDDVFRIARHRKHKTGKNAVTVLHLQKDGTINDLTKGTDKLTQEIVDKIVGSSYDVFKASIYCGQEQLPDLPAMTDKQLKILVEEAAGVTILEEAYKEARTRLATLKSEADVFEIRFEGAKKQVESEKERIDGEITNDIKGFEAFRKDKIEDLTTRARSRAEEAKSFATDIAAADKPNIEARIKACDAKIAAVAGEVEEDRKNEVDVAAARGRVDTCKREVAFFADRHDNIVKSLINVEHEIGCPCGDCGRPITAAEVAPRKAKLIEAQTDCIAKQTSAEVALVAAQGSLMSVTDKRDRFRASMTDVSATSAQRASLLKDLRGAELLERGRNEAIIGARGFLAEIETTKVQINPHHATLEKAKARLEKLEREVVDLEALRLEKQNALKIADMITKVFSPAGVRAHILDDVTPFLNDQTAKYLASLTDGEIAATWSTLVKTAKGELREKFSIEVEAANGGKTFSAISGGEKRKVRLAAALALQDLVARRATKPIDLFIGDEIDDALDAAGRERLMGVLDEKARERGSVFIISHSDLKDWISQVVTVIKPATGGSYIEEVEA